MKTIAKINMLMGYFTADWFSNHVLMPETRYHRLLGFCKDQVLMWEAGHRGAGIHDMTATVLAPLDEPCPTCNGRGVVIHSRPEEGIRQEICSACKGKGLKIQKGG